MVRVIIQGFGFMGRLHARCYRANPAAEVVGIIDIDTGRARSGARAEGLGDVPAAPSLAELPADLDAHALDICLPTDAHPEAAETAFAAGLHVFCEKPLALTEEAARLILNESIRAGRQLMVGHCIRFWPEYLLLREMYETREAGELLSLSLDRRASRPDYTVGNWISEPERCIGAALDFHIHDSDFIQFLLGPPDAVFAQGLHLPTGWDHIQTQYLYKGPIVRAEGGWNYPPAWGFRMSFNALFENGSLDFDSAASPTVRKIVDGRESHPRPDCEKGELADVTAYKRELDHFIDALENSTPVTQSTGAHALEAIRMVHAEIESARERHVVPFNTTQ